MNKAIDDLNKGDKVHVHVSIYEKPLAILDVAVAKYESSRAEVIEALLVDWSRGHMPGVVIEASARRGRKGTSE